tara:strand:+ start:438 stop:554 length:117 start_codon:yes stop_codon:yes gene_type:complete
MCKIKYGAEGGLVGNLSRIWMQDGRGDEKTDETNLLVR